MDPTYVAGEKALRRLEVVVNPAGEIGTIPGGLVLFDRDSGREVKICRTAESVAKRSTAKAEDPDAFSYDVFGRSNSSRWHNYEVITSVDMSLPVNVNAVREGISSQEGSGFQELKPGKFGDYAGTRVEVEDGSDTIRFVRSLNGFESGINQAWTEKLKAEAK
jgi:hypothetical protein